MIATDVNARRYDLDWLRIIAFGLLIFYHIGMYYVTWGYHVKSPHAGPFIEPAMMLLNPWRMPLIFLISGVALKFATDKGALASFAGRRFWRLIVPIVFGMAVIVTPQSYFELLAKGEIAPGYLDFWAVYLSGDESFSITVPTWNHLWYVVYLLVYTLLILPFMPLVRKLAGWLDSPWFEKLMSGGRLYVIPALIFVFYRFTTDMWYPEETHALFGDWGAHARYFSYFLIGILIAKNRVFWSVLASSWRVGALIALCAAVPLSYFWAHWEQIVEPRLWLLQPARAMRLIYAWAVIMALFGAAQEYLNRPSRTIAYLTEAVFPYYILHQSLIVVCGVFLSSMGLPAVVEFVGLLVATVGGCLLLHEYVIRRTPFLRPLFGVPMKPKKQKLQTAAAE